MPAEFAADDEIARTLQLALNPLDQPIDLAA
jgi:hypothetical protein